MRHMTSHMRRYMWLPTYLQNTDPEWAEGPCLVVPGLGTDYILRTSARKLSVCTYENQMIRCSNQDSSNVRKSRRCHDKLRIWRIWTIQRHNVEFQITYLLFSILASWLHFATIVSLPFETLYSKQLLRFCFVCLFSCIYILLSREDALGVFISWTMSSHPLQRFPIPSFP